MRKSARYVIAVLLGTAVAAAGCSNGPGGGANDNGVSKLGPHGIVNAARKALKAASSVHVVGSVATPKKTDAIDFDIFSTGDLQGTISQDGNTGQIIKVGSTDYLKGDSAFWVGLIGLPQSNASNLSGFWVSVPDTGSSGFGKSFTPTSLAAQLAPTGALTKGSTGTTDGQASVSVNSSQGGTLWVATTGTAYPIEIKGSHKKEMVDFTFSKWNSGVAPGVPAGAKPLSSYLSGAGPTGTSGTGTGTGTGSSTGTGTGTGTGTTGK